MKRGDLVFVDAFNRGPQLAVVDEVCTTINGTGILRATYPVLDDTGVPSHWLVWWEHIRNSRLVFENEDW